MNLTTYGFYDFFLWNYRDGSFFAKIFLNTLIQRQDANRFNYEKKRA